MWWEWECHSENATTIPITLIPTFILFPFWATFLLSFPWESHVTHRIPLAPIPMHTSNRNTSNKFEDSMTTAPYQKEDL